MRADPKGVKFALGGGVAALAGFAVVLLRGGGAWRAWLAAAVLSAALPAGAVTLSMMIRLIPGSWREGLHDPLAAAPVLVPLAALTMAPVLIAPGAIYGWTDQISATGFRGLYLTPSLFLIRGALWLALLAALAFRLRRGRAATAIVGLLMLVPFSLLISTDWLLSLDSDFSSSGFGLYVLAVEIDLVLALAVAAAVAKGVSERVRDVLGGVLFAGLAIWAYLGFMPYFIAWSGDLSPGVAWYRRREGAWLALVWAAMVLKGAPAAALIFGHVRRGPRALVGVALCAAAGAAPEVGWLVLPAPGAIAGASEVALFAGLVIAFACVAYGASRLARPPREATL